jgi:hypothetical protein
VVIDGLRGEEEPARDLGVGEPGAGQVEDLALAPGQPERVVHTVTVGGTPGWQIALLMTGTAVLAAAAAVLVGRIRTARRAQVTEGAH